MLWTLQWYIPFREERRVLVVVSAVFTNSWRYLCSTAVVLLYTTVVQQVKRVQTSQLAVEVSEGLPHCLQTLCGPPNQVCDVQCLREVLTNVDAQVFEAAPPLRFKLLDVRWLIR